MANDQSHDTRTTLSEDRVAAAVSLSVAGVSVGAFTPLVSIAASTLTNGSDFSTWKQSVVTDVQSKSGTQSVAITTNQTEVGSCPVGGSKVYAGYTGLPESVPVGSTIWYRVFCYFPSSYSFGYLWSTSDDAEANACGYTNNDGNGSLKFLVLDPESSNARLYLNISSTRRATGQPENAELTLISEAGGVVTTGAYKLPLDGWVSIQIGVKLASDSTGWMRAWAGEQLIAERLNMQTLSTSATGLANFGIGNIFNGFPFTDGMAGRDTFYIDEIVLATDKEGFGTPNGIDASGNAYIAPSTLAAGI